MSDLITICLPTNRPEGFERMAESAMVRAKNPQNIRIIGYVENRLTEGNIVNFAPMLKYPQITLISGTYPNTPGIGKRWNIAASLSEDGILFLGADDLEFKTQDWDIIVKEHINQPIGLLYPNDGRSGKPSHYFITRTFYNTVGYLWPPQFAVWYGDDWVPNLAKAAGCSTYLPKLEIAHLHYKSKLSEKDETYIISNPLHTADTKLYNETKDSSLFTDTVNKLKQVMNRKRI